MTARNRSNRGVKAGQRQQNSCSTSTIFISAIIIVAFGYIALVSLYHKNFNDYNILSKKSILKVIHNYTPVLNSKTSTIENKIDAKIIKKNKNETSKSNVHLNPQRISPLEPYHKQKGAFDMHFIHIPKCGGTSMTAILREVACKIDPLRNDDCCTNPGFCDWHAKRRCESIRGCINHIPQRPWIFKRAPSVTILREPISRILSAWFYRGHSPNNDFFQVRPYFKEIYQGKRPKILFDEYIEMMEYQNIQTRMLGADSFPYRNVTVNQQVFDLAVEAMYRIFFVGIQEEYDISVQVMLREFNMTLNTKIKKERDQISNQLITVQKAAIKSNETLLSRLRLVNTYDVQLYKIGLEKFCRSTFRYPELFGKLKIKTKTQCNSLLDV